MQHDYELHLAEGAAATVHPELSSQTGTLRAQSTLPRNRSRTASRRSTGWTGSCRIRWLAWNSIQVSLSQHICNGRWGAHATSLQLSTPGHNHSCTTSRWRTILQRKRGQNIPEAGMVMQRAPTNSLGLGGTYPHIPPQTPELVDHGAKFMQQRRMGRVLH